VKGPSLAGPLRSGEASRLSSMDSAAEQNQLWAAWWKEKQDKVGDRVEPQNLDRTLGGRRCDPNTLRRFNARVTHGRIAGFASEDMGYGKCMTAK
jgi:hypothetical protein